MRIRVERHVQFSNCAIKTKQNNALSGTVRVPKQVYRKGDRSFRFGGNMNLIVERV